MWRKARCRRLRAAPCASFRFLGAVVPVGRGTDSGLVDDNAPVREVNVPLTPNLDLHDEREPVRAARGEVATLVHPVRAGRPEVAVVEARAEKDLPD